MVTASAYDISAPTRLSVAEQDVVAEALRILKRKHRRGMRISGPTDTKDYFRARLCDRTQEVFLAMFLDTRHRVLGVEELFYGTIDGASVYPRVIVQRALTLNAAAVVVAHNHPSGDPQPSSADGHLTKRLKDALALVDVRVLDHIVVGSLGAISLAEQGTI